MYSFKGRSQGEYLALNGNFCFIRGTSTACQSLHRLCLQQFCQPQHAFFHVPEHCLQGDTGCLSVTWMLPPSPLRQDNEALTAESSSSRLKGPHSLEANSPWPQLKAPMLTQESRMLGQRCNLQKRPDPCQDVSFSLYSSQEK